MGCSLNDLKNAKGSSYILLNKSLNENKLNKIKSTIEKDFNIGNDK